MAETVSKVRIEVTITGKVIGDDGAELTIDESYVATFDDGTGTNQCGTVWQDRVRNLNTTSEDHDFAGSRTDFQGAAIAGTAMKFLYLRNLDSDSGDTLILKQGSANPMTTMLGGTNPTFTIPPNGILLAVGPVDGWTLTGGSADTIACQTADNTNYRAIIGLDNT